MNPQREWLHGVVTREPDGECIDWPWLKTKRGYGVFSHRRVTHIVMELMGLQRPTPDHMTLHSCDRPPCCAPWHIRWGTNEENVAERVERGNNLEGEDHGGAKLTEHDVRAIRLRYSEGESKADLSRRFGVSSGQIRRIVLRIHWDHVE